MVWVSFGPCLASCDIENMLREVRLCKKKYRSNVEHMSVPSRRKTAYEEFTKEMCEAWAANPSRNPATGRAIDKNAVKRPNVYDRIAEACKKHGITVGSPRASPSQPGPSVPSKSTRIPKDVKKAIHGHRFPSSVVAWQNMRNSISNIFSKVEKFGFVSKYSYRVCEAFVRHYDNAVKYDLLPNDVRRSSMNTSYEKAKQVLKVKDVISDDIGGITAIKSLDESTWSMILGLLDHGTVPRNEDVNNLLQKAKRNRDAAEYKGDTFAMQEAETVLEKIESLIAISKEVELEKAEHANIGEDEHIPDSRLRSTPGSISRETDRSRKFSASYKRHSKLSAISPFEHASPSYLNNLDQKTRQQLLKELKQACTIMKDTITYDRFDRLNKKNLMLIVKLGKGEGNKHCFYVRNIFNAWKQAVKDNKPFVDPLNGVPVTMDEKDDIMQKMRFLKKDVKDPRDIAQQVPKVLKLVFTPKEFKDQDGIIHNFYEITLQTKHKYGKLVLIKMKLGYIPADIEPEDMGGSLNLSSAVLISHLHKLFENGRLLTLNSAPYQCCRVHLRKPMEYWLDPDGPKGISERRFVMMVEEVERYL